MSDLELVERIKNGDAKAFEQLYHAYYPYLASIAYGMISDSHKAKDLCQEVFTEIWKKRAALNVKHSFKAYLRRSVVNRTLNYIKAQRLSFSEDEKEDAFGLVDGPSAQELLELDDLKAKIAWSIEQLPPKCRQIFTLSRFSDMSNADIAESMGISLKTVENQITKAYKILRLALNRPKKNKKE